MWAVPREGATSGNYYKPTLSPAVTPPTQFHFEGTSGHSTPMVPPSSPLSFEEDTDMESVLSLSSPGIAQSAAEKAREKKLRDDPMAIVLGPLYVDCKRCGTRIKLSSKSLYDAFHWRTHRSRCLKRQAGKPKKQKPKGSKSPLERSPRSEAPQTPPLAVVDQEEIPIETIMAIDRETSLAQDPTTPPNSRHADVVFEEYLLRSNRKKQPSLPRSLVKWQDWSWSQLLLPQFRQSTDAESRDSDGLFIPGNATQGKLHHESITIPALSQSV